MLSDILRVQGKYNSSTMQTKTTKPSHRPGFFISFEGGEGSGKTTQIKWLKESLEQGELASILQNTKTSKSDNKKNAPNVRGITSTFDASIKSPIPTVTIVRNPGGTPFSEALRSLVLHAKDPVSQRCEALLFVAGNAQIVEQVIEPHLANGDIVICDRFVESSVVYQGYAQGLDIESIRQLNYFSTNRLLPDLTILLDVDPVIGLARQGDRNRMEDLGIEFHQRVRSGFLKEAALFPERIHIVNANQSPDNIKQEILEIVEKALFIF